MFAMTFPIFHTPFMHEHATISSTTLNIIRHAMKTFQLVFTQKNTSSDASRIQTKNTKTSRV